MLVSVVRCRRTVGTTREDDVGRRRDDTLSFGLVDPVLDREGGLDGSEGVGVGTGRHERGEDHVAASSGPAVERERLHVPGSIRRGEKGIGRPSAAARDR